ncbi:CopG family transcriptional regulator [Rhizobium lentis]|uniref:CopG family transcriptional regulator n=1 Tax=Rhizobium lentis TaxID=1138194 RepID=UPI001A916C0D|nr:CopG family transcriptional regulator [Rhizobium lentis]MBX5063345.1 CopG family transcriptional regulator [Rhizobium lentis]MBX5075450.1 CopG family transcriptional regulator [Rhizobium lentis]QSW93101.1 CopG family transcriptional regulator [Rhizobium lentis]
MTKPDTATLLEDAASRIDEIPTRDLQIMLRRAALLVRNAGSIALDDDIEEALRNVSSELVLTRDDAIRYIVREWMEQNTYLPVHELDEEGDVDGSA